VKSSIPAGQPLKGLNFLKNGGDPVALADDEYPAWLWTLLVRQEKKGDVGAGDLFCMFYYYYYSLPHFRTPHPIPKSRQSNLRYR
jgi:hypothetical protein